MASTRIDWVAEHCHLLRSISAAALSALRATLADGGRIAYAADPALTTIQVIAS